ncbi:PepSY domain-containing protein [Cupriavidus agavae]|uniref:Peptidase YpeB-like protein n=1 Tax=Cupriavidus agavae TaxID=1001822 RepID=A0A4V2FH54_9BURK|nr:PepSY domain-containing protein [Cupriavidus agavae]RZT39089.1 peptidase YpeB-like protein [Cupriavidus agavae]
MKRSLSPRLDKQLAALGRTVSVAAVLGFVTLAGPAQADTDGYSARAALRSGDIVPLSKVLDAVNRQYNGDVIEVKLDRDHGRWTYEVELLLPSGAIAELEYDARDLKPISAWGHELDKAHKPPAR